MVIRFAWTQRCTMETTIEKHCSTTQNPQTMRRRIVAALVVLLVENEAVVNMARVTLEEVVMARA